MWHLDLMGGFFDKYVSEKTWTQSGTYAGTFETWSCHSTYHVCPVCTLGDVKHFLITLFCYRLLLWDCDDRSYSYYIEVSRNEKDWDIICDRSEVPCRSWQVNDSLD